METDIYPDQDVTNCRSQISVSQLTARHLFVQRPVQIALHLSRIRIIQILRKQISTK